MFYNYDKLISYNALFNFVIGERGVGKTYGAIKQAIKDFLKDGSQFIYLRRYKSELQSSVPRFFDAIEANNEFEGHEFKVKDGKFYIDGEVAGYPVALSTSNILKSTSFAKVKTIIFDEFILDRGTYHYLRNEVTQLLDAVETIARLKDVKVYFLGNAISISNPYFNYFKLSLPYNKEFKTFKQGLIVVNYVKNQAYREAKKNSRFGRLIDGTEYGAYAIDNEFLRDSDTFILKKSGNCRFLFILKLNGCKFGLYEDSEGRFIVSNDYDPDYKITFSVNEDDHDEDTMLWSRQSQAVRTLVGAYRQARLYFENIQIKNSVLDGLKKWIN